MLELGEHDLVNHVDHPVAGTHVRLDHPGVVDLHAVGGVDDLLRQVRHNARPIRRLFNRGPHFFDRRHRLGDGGILLGLLGSFMAPVLATPQEDLKQFREYFEIFGEGMVVYWYGYLKDLPANGYLIKDYSFFEECEEEVKALLNYLVYW